MNVNFGLFPPVDATRPADGKRLKPAERAIARKRAYTERAKSDFSAWLGLPKCGLQVEVPRPVFSADRSELVITAICSGM